MRPGANKYESQKPPSCLASGLHFPASSFSSHTHTLFSPFPDSATLQRKAKEALQASSGQNFSLQTSKTFPNVDCKANAVYFLTAFCLFECHIFLLVNFPLIKPLIHQWHFLIYNRLTELMLLTSGFFFFFYFLSFFFFPLVCFPGHADLFSLDCFTFVFNVSLNVIVKACML